MSDRITKLDANVQLARLAASTNSLLKEATILSARLEKVAARLQAATCPSSSRICVMSAWTTDYLAGYLTAAVNEQYANKHGYHWHCDILSPDSMQSAITPRGHGTWYKVLMLNRFLADPHRCFDWLVWLDADACVVDDRVTIESFIQESGGRDLIIAEDMTPTSKVNCGVMIIRVSDWSRRLWAGLWECPLFKQWHSRTFHEQSSLCRWLKLHEPGFGDVKPWFSYAGGPPKRTTKHTFVLPHSCLNTNLGGFMFQKHRRKHKVERFAESGPGPKFIFHAVGCSPKVAAIRTILVQRGVCSSLVDRVSDQYLSMIVPKLILGRALGDSGMQDIVSSYPVDAGLRFLGLELNELTVSSAKSIARIIETNCSLEVVRLGGNQLGDLGVEIIAHALQKCSFRLRLRVLDISRNRLTVTGLRIILEAFVNNNTLVTLDLSGNGLGNDVRCRGLVENHLRLFGHGNIEWTATTTPRDRDAVLVRSAAHNKRNIYL